MTDIKIYTKLHSLSPSLKNEVNDFVDFLLNKHEKEGAQKKPLFGCAKGKFKMSTDFDQPLDDFKDYM